MGSHVLIRGKKQLLTFLLPIKQKIWNILLNTVIKDYWITTYVFLFISFVMDSHLKGMGSIMRLTLLKLLIIIIINFW